MSEYLSFTSGHFNAAQAITCTALETVDSRYSTGFPDFDGREHTPLTYHNGYHARAVSRDAVTMAAALDLSRAEQAIAEAAGAAHDIVQLKGSGLNEAGSAEWLAEQLREEGIFPEAAVHLGSLAILGTEPLFDDDGVLMGQKAMILEYPSKRAELVTKSVACADLGELYTPQGPYLSHELYRELRKFGPNETPPLDGLIGFQRGQLRLTTHYGYPLEKANRVLASHRSEVEAYTERVLTQLERGEIESWRQLIDQDMQLIVTSE